MKALIIDKINKISAEIESSDILKKQLLDESLNSIDSSGMGYEKTIQAWLFNELKTDSALNSQGYIVQLERKMVADDGIKIADMIIKNAAQLFDQENAELIIELGHQHLFQNAQLVTKFSDDLKKWDNYDALHVQIVTCISELDAYPLSGGISLRSFNRAGGIATRKASHWKKIEVKNLTNLAYFNNGDYYKAENVTGSGSDCFSGNSLPAVKCIFECEDVAWLFKVWFVISEKRGAH